MKSMPIGFRPVAHCFLLLLLAGGGPRTYAQTDTSYFRSYYKKAVARIVYTYRTRDFYFSSKLAGLTTTNSFHTGNEFFIGADASYKWAGLNYSISLTPNQSKRNTNVQFSTTYKPLRFQMNVSSLQNLNYSVTREKSGATLDTVLSERENDVQIVTARMKLDYVFNYRRYGYSASFSQSGRQLKNAGSVIASIALSSDNFFLDKLDGPAKTIFDSTYGFTRTLMGGVEAGVGYGYNWVPGKHWTISVVEQPNVAVQLINTQTVEPQLSYRIIGFVNHFKLGVAYTRGRCAIGLSGYTIAGSNKMKHSNYSNIYNSVDVYVGWIIDTKKKLLLLF